MNCSIRWSLRWLAASMICVAGGANAWATAFSSPAAVTTCIGGLSQQFCQTAGRLSGPIGIVPPSMLVDLNALSVSSDGQSNDRSAEMDLSEISGTVPVVMGPGLLSSMQLSFDSRMDLSATQAQTAQFARLELTLGSVLSGSGVNPRIDERRLLGNTSGYMSFALVNQSHTAAPRAAAPEESEEDDEFVLQ